MLDETEQRIFAKLDKFEKETKFTKKSVSLTYLALYCDTNTKYLSQVINTHKNKDFNNYINELRVRSEEHTSELQSRGHLVCRLLLEKKNTTNTITIVAITDC